MNTPVNSHNTAKTYAIPTAAAGGLTLQMRGVYVFIASASENLNIQVFDEDHNQVGDIENFPAGLGQPFAGGFSQLVISTASGAAGQAQLAIGTDMATFTALTGTVNIIDETAPKYAAMRGRGYIAGVFIAGAATEYVAHKLRNPAGSGVNLIVTGLQAEGGGSAVDTDWWLAASAGADLATVRASMPRLGGGAAALGVFSWQQTVAAGRPAEPADSAVLPLQATMTEPLLSGYPLVVPPGYEVVVLGQTAGSAQGVTFAWEEWALGAL